MNGISMYGGRLPQSALVKLRDKVEETGGFTVLYDNDTTGRYVIGIKGFTVHLESLKLRHIEHIATFSAAAGADGFGAWLDGGIVYLDAITTRDSEADALSVARQFEQLAIYDSVTGDSIYLHNSSTDT